MAPTIRPASEADLNELKRLANTATRDLLGPFLSPAQRAQAAVFTPFDPWLIADGTYFVAEIDGVIRAAGGWSRRSVMIHEPDGIHGCPEADPSGPARIRAMYTDPAFARRGLGRAILSLSEISARLSGHASLELLATPVGHRLYLSCGYETLEARKVSAKEGVTFPVFLMRKRICDA